MSTRRGHGEGSITQRKDSRWEAKIDLGYVNGKRKRKSIYGKTRREVAEKLKKALRDQQQGLPVAYERQTVGQFMQDWLEDSVRLSTRPKTYRSYEQLTRNHIQPELGRIPLEKLTPQQVQKLLNEKRASGLSASTVQRIHATLRRALNIAMRWDLVPRNVATLVEVPRGERKTPKPFDVHEAQRFLHAVKTHRLYALFAVALATGLRKGELLGLRWENVDLDKGTVEIHGQLQRIGGETQIVPTKSARSNRTLNLPAFAADALRQHRESQQEERDIAGSRWDDWDVVFASTIGTPMEERNLTRIFHLLLDEAGLRRIRFHDLRHSCASFLYAQNVHPRVIMETLGHSQISVTMDLYGHMLPALQEEAAQKIDNLLQIETEPDVDHVP